MENKDYYRKIAREKRDSISKDDKYIIDGKIYDNVIKSSFYKKAQNIFIYVSVNSEADTRRIIQKALDDEKTVCVPKVISKKHGMIAVRINGLNELSKGAYGIPEPIKYDKKFDEHDIDLILLPGLAFDECGGRIGYGGGFYDRFISITGKNTVKIGLAYSCQIFDKVTCLEYDEPLDVLITEKSVQVINQLY